MKLFTLKKTVVAFAFGLITLLGVNQIANAQGNRNDQRKERQRVEKQRQNDERQRRNVEKQRQKDVKQRQKVQQMESRRQDIQIRTDQRREQTRIRNLPRQNQNTSYNRIRVNRSGNYYQTDYRGAELLRQAVNAGYQEGYRAGRNDRNRRRADNYNNSSVYRNGSFGYQNYVTRSQYQYYFQQGFQRGYQDGYNSRYEYGSYNNGSLSILGSILSVILNIETY